MWNAILKCPAMRVIACAGLVAVAGAPPALAQTGPGRPASSRDAAMLVSPPRVGVRPPTHVDADSTYIWEIYRDFHEHPELGKQEQRTHDRIKAELTRLGYTQFLESPSAPTAVITVLETGRPGPTIALRAEMDARPTQEPAGHTPRSLLPNRMHSCGHDAHAAILLGTAMRLKRDASRLTGRVVFLFQPAEETKGGADDIVADGVLGRLGVQAIFAQHVVAGQPVGTMSVSAGPTLAGSSTFTLRIKGRNSHAAQPSAGDDVLLATTSLVQGMATFPARRIDLVARPVVISPTYIAAGEEGTTNVIPGEAVVKGTIRAFEPVDPPVPTPTSIRALLTQYLDGAAKGLGVTYELSIAAGSPPTVNDPALFGRLAAPLATRWTGTLDTTPYRGMFSEDFAYYTATIPSLYFGLGIAKGALGGVGVHSEDFTIHPSALVQGVAFLVTLAEVATTSP